jgi:hypothetical protein
MKPAILKSVKELQGEFLKLKSGMFIHFNMEICKERRELTKDIK